MGNQGTVNPAAPETAVTSIVGPCGRFIIPLEPAINRAFHLACEAAGADPSQELAAVCHSRILALSEWGARKQALRTGKGVPRG